MGKLEHSLMKLHEYSLLFMAVMGILTLLLASPAISRLLVFPRTEFFTELWILDSNHRAENYPFNITRNHNYTIFLGIANRLGYDAYYLVEVKFRNQTQLGPNSFNRTPSNLPTLLNITAFVADETTWERPLVFSFDYEYDETLSQVEFYTLTLAGGALDMRNHTMAWDSKSKGFFGNLFFELWIYNQTMGKFQYHERFVSLWLNMTRS